MARIRAKMARAVAPGAVLGGVRVHEALGLATIAGRFAEDDLVSILDHLGAAGPPDDVVHVDEAHSAQPATGSWDRFGA